MIDMRMTGQTWHGPSTHRKLAKMVSFAYSHVCTHLRYAYLECVQVKHDIDDDLIDKLLQGVRVSHVLVCWLFLHVLFDCETYFKYVIA